MAITKRHRCEVQGCGKAFSRPSHLQRHALNHSNAQWICERCNACFKRLDLLERHKSRHSIKDRRAGGVGLGVLETKSKHFRDSSSGVIQDSGQPPILKCQIPSSASLSTSQPSRTQGIRDVSQTPSNVETLALQVYHDDEACVSSRLPGLRRRRWQSDVEMLSPEHDTSSFPQQSHAFDFANGSTPPALYDIMDQSPGFHDMGNMYHDMTFDLVHFNVMGFTPGQHELVLPISPPSQALVQEPVDSINSMSSTHREQHAQTDPLPPWEASSEPQSVSRIVSVSRKRPSSRQRVQDNSTKSPGDTPELQPSNIFNRDATTRGTAGHEPGGQSNTDAGAGSEVPGTVSSVLAISPQKREELLEFIGEIRPVRPNGTLIDDDSPDFGLENLQNYLDLFFEFFNTTYPIVHVATLNIGDIDPIALLSMILLGATYKDKDAHQLSVCLYDALIPYILSGLLGSPAPDLSILQSFLILECYGMYRAGPYQRENAILIHALLWNSIRRITRYHVRARIILPDRLTHQERDWQEFAYAEQYRRLILFFFMWDTQNVTCYSFMPNMSVHPIQIGIPCSQKLWDAKSESEWKELVVEHDETQKFKALVERFVASDEEMLSKPYDFLGFTLALHGLMSMCNDMLHFDNRSMYMGSVEGEDLSLSPWHQQMAHALESWKAKYDAFAMGIIWEMQSEPLHCEFQRDSMSLFALYHIAHIVINCEVRHLQIAAGAKAIFGHIVTPSDYKESCDWVRQWIRESPASAGRAAWHAAQMFREGMLNLKAWDVHGAFHYPWCLYIGTLTCWTYHHFGRETMSLAAVCKHHRSTELEELQSTGRDRMNHLVSTMASVTPTTMDRVMGRCCTHGLTLEMAKYLRGVRWTAAYEAMKILEGLSGIREDHGRRRLEK